MVSIYNALWSLGSIVAAWTTYGTFRMNNNWGWRIPSLLQALSSVIQILLFFWIVESPRWLVSKDRLDEARDIITTYHANGDPHDPIVVIELEEIREALRLEQTAAAGTSWVSFFKTKGNRLRFTIILAVGFFSQWSGNGLISASSPWSQVSHAIITNRITVLSHSNPRLHRIHDTGQADPHKWNSHNLESGHHALLLLPGEQVQTQDNVFDLNHCYARLLRR